MLADMATLWLAAFLLTSLFAQAQTDTYRPPPKRYRSKTIDELILQASKPTKTCRDLTCTIPVQQFPWTDRPTDERPPKTGIRDDLYTAELDMNLTPEQMTRLYGDNHISKRKATGDARLRWPNHTIPYEIHNGSFDSDEIAEIKDAMSEWERLTCVTFKPAVDSDVNRILLQNGYGCNSAVGMIGGVQVVNLQKPGCRFRGLYLHETGHAIGLVHEHQLPNRDDYISIRYTNVDPSMRIWFDKYSNDAVDQMGVEYDYSSIMHYGKTAFSYNGKAQTIFTKDKSKEQEIGQVAFKSLSFSDVKTVSLMYGCSKHCPSLPPCENPCFVDKHCKCFCKKDMPERPCLNEDSDKQCDEWASRGECEGNSEYMHISCRKSCKLCQSTSGGVGFVVSEGPCENAYDEKKCTDWAAIGECQKNSMWMRSNCRKACDACKPGNVSEQVNGKNETICINQYGDGPCQDWADKGECQANPSFMLTECRKACGRCLNNDGDDDDNTPDNVTKTIVSSAACKDNESACKSWAKYCSSNTYVIKNCPKTCNRCDKLSL